MHLEIQYLIIRKFIINYNQLIEGKKKITWGNKRKNEIVERF